MKNAMYYLSIFTQEWLTKIISFAFPLDGVRATWIHVHITRESGRVSWADMDLASYVSESETKQEDKLLSTSETRGFWEKRERRASGALLAFYFSAKTSVISD